MVNRNENEIEFKINEEQVLMFLDAGCTIVKNGGSIIAKSQYLAFLQCTPSQESEWVINDAVCLLILPHEMPIVISMSRDNDELSYVITKITSETLANILLEV